MIRIPVLEDELGDLNRDVARFVNDNLTEIVRTLLTHMSMGTEPEDFIPVEQLGFTSDDLKQLIYDVYYMVKSDLLRDVIKPKYQYILMMILDWWQDLQAVCHYVPREMDEHLADAIRKNYEDDEEGVGDATVKLISDPTRYEEILFSDYDFLPECLETILSLHLDSNVLFASIGLEFDLSEYRELMPADLREIYDETKAREEEFRENTEPKKTSRLKQFAYNVFEGLVTNAAWAVLIVIGTILLGLVRKMI